MKKLLAAIALTVAYVGAFEDPAHSATFKPVAGGDALEMVGAIVPGDAERLNAAYAASVARYGFAPSMLFLNSEGGSVGASFALADAVRRFDLGAVIADDDWCLSACVTVFAAAPWRAVFPTSLIGVHSAREDGAAGETAAAAAVTLEIARRMLSYGAPAAVTAKMITTAPDDMAYLDASDVAQWAEVLD